MNQLTNVHNPFQIYIKIFLNKYTYKNITLYMVKLNPHIHKFVHKHIIMFELNLFNG